MNQDKKEPTLKDLFSFEKRDVSSYMMHTMRLDKKFKSAFNYLISKIKVKELPKDLSRIKWDEGKNYDWATFKYKNVELIIRKYHTHFTIYFKFAKEMRENDGFVFMNVKYGCFVYTIDRDKLSDNMSDSFVDNPFQDLNKRILSIVDEIEEGHSFGLWNPYSATIESDEMKGDMLHRPDYVKIKNIWDGGSDDISSIDDFIFACEELFGKYLEYFSHNEMLEKIKTIKVKQVIGGYTVSEKRTKVDDEYYHDAGLELINNNFPKDKGDWSDVYSLSRYHLEDVFGGDVPLYAHPDKKKGNKILFDMNDY